MAEPMSLSGWGGVRPEFKSEGQFEIIDGTCFSKDMTNVEAVRGMKTYDKMRDDDVIISSYPRSGTHWSIALVDLVMHGGDIETVKERHIHERSIWMDVPMTVFRGETDLSMKAIEETPNPMIVAESAPSPRLLSTHLPYNFMPESVKQGKCKVVAILRNPKSVLVSNHLLHAVPELFDVVPTLDNSIDAMLADTQDQMVYGSWYNHVSRWWLNRDKANIHCILYEDMKMNMGDVIKGLARFLNKSIPNERIEKMAEHLQFDKMLKNPKTGKAFEKLQVDSLEATGQDLDALKTSHMRKGTIDDWKTKLTVAQNERIDAHLGPKLKNIGLKFPSI
ncbi:unnamed protein product [Owenia fusiformis]|uniref:Uncharacterized protein n=1 Tax=Owenia fusiformis TaxID=6347 RepID=A0A8J1Y413_OWEFU|nr:unnamed protein product [Owenia fusiformis]